MRSEVSPKAIEDIYRQILQPSFNANELDTLDTVLDGLAADGSDEAWGLCAFDGETPVGCVLGYPFPASRVLLIGYVAVKPGLRSRGVGRLLMGQAEAKWYGKDDLALVVAEVEDPRHHPTVGDLDPKRRAEFYERLGAQVVVGPYFQPRLDGEGKKRAYNLFLTVFGGNGEAITPDNSVRAAIITDFLVEYFRQSGEGIDWPLPSDEEGNSLLAWYRGRETVPLHPIGDYARIQLPRIGG
jgi:GNAT superfamily N-acetyltransferase